ncbi:MAG: transglycosylase SLT domain-containing protein [Bacteroides sp.]|nr:transglycosylase SLT domain-containing protein [Bacteroides sp.]
MLLEEKYSGTDKAAFLAEVKNVAGRLAINPDWLMAVMYKESGLAPAAVNRSSGATGLIQFMPSTAAALGTSTAALKTMTGKGQLAYVEKYFRPYIGRLGRYEDVYMAVFFPAALGKADDWTFQSSRLLPGTIAGQNPAVDLNKDQKITVAEFREYCFRGFSAAQVEFLKKKREA